MLGLLRIDGQVVHHRVVAGLLLGIQLGGPSHQLSPGLGGEVPHGLVTEHRLEQPLGQEGRAAGDADLGPGQAHASG